MKLQSSGYNLIPMLSQWPKLKQKRKLLLIKNGERMKNQNILIRPQTSTTSKPFKMDKSKVLTQLVRKIISLNNSLRQHSAVIKKLLISLKIGRKKILRKQKVYSESIK
jgi:hypothetical protein